MNSRNSIYTAIREYIDIVQGNPKNPYTIEYLFNVLKETGLLMMAYGAVDEALLKNVRAIFCLNQIPPSETNAPSFMDVSLLGQKLELFEKASGSLHESPTAPPHEDAAMQWEEELEDVISYGMDLLYDGLSITAVRIAEKRVVSDSGQNISPNWQGAWNCFIEPAQKYMDLLTYKKAAFHVLADEAISLMATYIYMPDDDDFKTFLNDVARPRKDFVKHQFYRKLFTGSKVSELFSQAEENYDENLGVSLAYVCEAAVAQKAITSFIVNHCSCLLDETGGNNRIQGLSASPGAALPGETPFVLTGDKLFTIHLLRHGLSGWGIRKDPAALAAIEQTGRNFKGALFCSWQQYPNGAWICRLDAYRDEKEFWRLINKSNESFVRIDYETICGGEDRREEFLEKAARAVLGRVDAGDITDALIESGYTSDTDLSENPLLSIAMADPGNFADQQAVRRMAAAGPDIYKANMIIVKDKGLEIQPTLVTILAKDLHKDVVTVSGETDPASLPPQELLAWWAAPDQSISAAEIKISEDKQFFTIKFSGIRTEAYDEGRLIMLFIRYAGK